jgi:hypothetical protein
MLLRRRLFNRLISRLIHARAQPLRLLSEARSSMRHCREVVVESAIGINVMSGDYYGVL